jgi:hypothetical protein
MLPPKIAVCRTADEPVDCHGYGLILPGNVRDLSCPATSDVPHNNSNRRRLAKAATADLRRRRLPLFASRSALRIAAQRNTGSASEPPPIGAPPTVGVSSRRRNWRSHRKCGVRRLLPRRRALLRHVRQHVLPATTLTCFGLRQALHRSAFGVGGLREGCRWAVAEVVGCGLFFD